MKIIKVGDLCDVIKGKSLYTKSYGSIHKGEYPVFSASNNAPLTFIDSYDFDGKYITRATNGFAGYIKVIDEKFSINGDRGVLVPKVKNIDIDYMKFVLEPILRGLAKGRKGDNAENEFTKVYPWMVEQVEIQIPVDKNGNFDLLAQQEIASSYILLDEYKKQLQNYQQRIEQLQVIVEEIGESKAFRIDEIFDFSISTNNSKFTKTFVQANPGNIPVYSASKELEAGYGYIADNVPGIKYFENCLTRNIDGSIGIVFYRKERFSLSEKVIPLVIRDIYKDQIDMMYLKSTVENTLASQAYGFGNKAGSGKIGKISIQIPILLDGTFDLIRQQEIAHIYETIAQIKQQVSEKLQALQDVQVIL